MAIKGNLREASLPDVLQLLALGQKTGCLSVTDRSNLGYVYFERAALREDQGHRHWLAENISHVTAFPVITGTGEPVAIYIPPGPRQYGVAGSGQAGARPLEPPHIVGADASGPLAPCWNSASDARNPCCPHSRGSGTGGPICSGCAGGSRRAPAAWMGRERIQLPPPRRAACRGTRARLGAPRRSQNRSRRGAGLFQLLAGSR